MTFDNELSFITTTLKQNEWGDMIETREERKVLCDVLSVTRNEYYEAAAHGLKPETVFIVNRYEYQGEKDIEFDGKEYRVLRTFEPKLAKGIGTFETIELVAAGVINDGDA